MVWLIARKVVCSLSQRVASACVALFLGVSCAAAQTNPIVFVTYLPNPRGFGTIAETFGNHLASQSLAGRGGDLYIRYPDGSLKNITEAAGFGNAGFQGATSIAVRDPAVHWNGQKVIFSMVVGSPAQRYATTAFYWQLYEVTNLGKNQTPQITKVPNQPENFNNIMPVYGTNGRIIFVSDRTLTGERHLYPQRDEYEAAPINSGLWSLNPNSGDLFVLDHSPSGDFHPIIDSYGRVIFTRWDHMQRDQENIGVDFGAFNYNSEAADATSIGSAPEVFPEPRTTADPEYVSTLNTHSFNHFFPWMVREDGHDLETLNHVGRHELHGYIPRSFNNDTNLDDYYQQYSRTNTKPILNFFHIRENPLEPGTYVGIDAPEFGTHAAGQIFSMTAPPQLKAGDITVTYLTHRDTANSSDNPDADHIGLSRTPIITTDGILIASHTANTRQDSNLGSSTAPRSRFDFRIKTFSKVGAHYVPGTNLTPGIVKTVSFWDPDQLLTFDNVTMWEMQPVELVARSIPSSTPLSLESPEQSVLDSKGVTLAALRTYLEANNLALVISRDVTTRDGLDLQQPFNLKVAGSSSQTVGAGGKIYDVGHLQFFIGKLIRGYTQAPTGRRVLAQTMDEVHSVNPSNANGPAGSVAIGADGSMAAFVPARRALTWQLTDPAGSGVVRERYWLTFGAGEVRVCASCHGITSAGQDGAAAPTNPPEALATLLDYWKAGGGPGSGGGSVAKVSLSAKRLNARSYRLKGRVLLASSQGVAAAVTLLKVTSRGTTEIATTASNATGTFTRTIAARKITRIRARVGSKQSRVLTIGR